MPCVSRPAVSAVFAAWCHRSGATTRLYLALLRALSSPTPFIQLLVGLLASSEEKKEEGKEKGKAGKKKSKKAKEAAAKEATKTRAGGEAKDDWFPSSSHGEDCKRPECVEICVCAWRPADITKRLHHFGIGKTGKLSELWGLVGVCQQLPCFDTTCQCNVLRYPHDTCRKCGCRVLGNGYDRCCAVVARGV
jgi:hypothetical protein